LDYGRKVRLGRGFRGRHVGTVGEVIGSYAHNDTVLVRFEDGVAVIVPTDTLVNHSGEGAKAAGAGRRETSRSVNARA
jgi:hypothetical protein